MVKRNAIATKLTKVCTQTQKWAFDVAVSSIVYLHRSLAGWPVLQCVGGGGWPRASEASIASTPES